MIALRPTYRVFAVRGARTVEALHTERAAPADDAVIAVLGALRAGPVDDAGALSARIAARGLDVERGAVRGALSLLSGLGLIRTRDEPEGALWAALADGLPPFPLVDQVELTNVCPMSCVMCPTGTGAMTRAKGRMSRAVFTRLVDEIAAHGEQVRHGKPLTLHNLGESLLHDELPGFVAYARERGLATEVAGNPGHLTPERYDALVESGLTRLVLDVDGLDAATLEAVRGKGARGDRAFAHLEHVLARRAARPDEGPELVLQMIAQPLNQGQTGEFLARYRRGLARVEVYVKALDANTRTHDGLVEIGARPLRTLCRAPWKSVVVLWDGTVIPCCHDENGALALGSLVDDPLLDIWRGEGVRRLRAAMTNGVHGASPCASCAHRADRYRAPDPTDIPDAPLSW